MSDPGSMSSAANVYQKLVPQPVRAVAASKVSPRVRRGVKRRLARTLAGRESRLHQRALRRLREAGPADEPQGRTTARDGRVGHVHRELTPELARRIDHDLVTTTLDMAKIPWFAVPALDDRRIALAVPQEHKGAVRRVLRALLEERTGYVVSVSPANSDNATVPGSHVKAWSHYAKARVIRVVWLRTDPTESLWIGDDQGVEIEFWTTNTDLPTPRLVGPRPNRVQRVVLNGIQPVEIPFERMTGYADIDGEAEPTLTQDGFDIPRLEEVTFPVDAVVLWQHAGPWAEELLRATLRSLHQYAPWVDLVHLVATVPVPAWVRLDDRLTMVTAGPDAEAHLHRLPELADHFLLLRPGALFTRPVRPFDYFTPAGSARPRRGPWTAEESQAPWSGTAFSFTGRAVSHGFGSGPQPYVLSVVQAVADGYDWSQYTVDAQTAPRLAGTHPMDGLLHHAGHCTGHAEISGEASLSLHAALPGVTRWLDRLLVRRDAQQIHLFGLGTAEAQGRGGTAAVLDFLRHYFPVTSPFEYEPDQEPEPRR